jgi:hypothetical protein
MKKKVFCAFLLITWVLVVCTILSGWIERQMTAKVTRVFANSKSLELPADSLIWEENGVHLYKIEEGTGWSYGTRAASVAENEYMLANGTLRVQNWANYNFIHYSSKTIADGDLIEVQTTTPGEEGSYLVLSDGNEAQLVSLTLDEPFMEAQAKSALSMQQGKVYSLTEVRKFLENLPLLALLLVFLIVPVILWGYSCANLRKFSGNKRPLFINGTISFLMTGGIVWLGNRIALPSSLLPDNNIFQLSHYRQEFSAIFQNLAAFTDPAVSEVTRAATQNLWYSGGILLLGVVFTVVVVLLERR